MSVDQSLVLGLLSRLRGCQQKGIKLLVGDKRHRGGRHNADQIDAKPAVHPSNALCAVGAVISEEDEEEEKVPGFSADVESWWTYLSAGCCEPRQGAWRYCHLVAPKSSFFKAKGLQVLPKKLHECIKTHRLICAGPGDGHG